MFYREAGQFKSSYAADQAVFPITQDRIFIGIWLLIGFVAIPLLANEYLFRAIFIPFLILALAALGLNLLVGYCGQVSLGTGAFMAVGAYAAYNFWIRVDGLNPLIAFILAGGVATLVGIVFGIPSLRIKGFYLAVATLAVITITRLLTGGIRIDKDSEVQGLDNAFHGERGFEIQM